MLKKVFIAVGHGGIDSGAVANGLKEKDMTLTMAIACQNHLKANGVDVKMSRYCDENDDVSEEVKECNNFNPDLAFAAHVNAGGGDGFEAFYSILGGLGKTLAANIEAEVKVLGQNSRGIKTRKNSKGKDYYAFIRKTKCPAVIGEIGFIDNKNDLQAFDEEHELKAYGVAYAKGILKTLGIIENTQDETPNPTPQPPKPTKPSGYDEWVARLQNELNVQFNRGLVVDGLRGPKTLNACPTVKKRARGNVTRLIQERLNSVGFNLACDGIFGSGTYNAVKVFQRNRGLSQDGIVGKNTWNWLLKGTRM